MHRLTSYLRRNFQLQNGLSVLPSVHVDPQSYHKPSGDKENWMSKVERIVKTCAVLALCGSSIWSSRRATKEMKKDIEKISAQQDKFEKTMSDQQKTMSDQQEKFEKTMSDQQNKFIEAMTAQQTRFEKSIKEDIGKFGNEIKEIKEDIQTFKKSIIEIDAKITYAWDILKIILQKNNVLEDKKEAENNKL